MSSVSFRLPGWLAAATLALAASLPAAAAPVTLDFQHLNSGTIPSGRYERHGFSLSVEQDSLFSRMFMVDVLYPSLPGRYMAGWSAIPDNPVQITLARSDGGLFRLDGLDLGIVSSLAGDVTFRAYDAAGALQATQTFASVDTAVNGFTSFAFGDGFHEVARVVWSQSAHWETGHAFDNILLDQGPAQGVPEPGSLALAGVALAGLAVVRRRRA